MTAPIACATGLDDRRIKAGHSIHRNAEAVPLPASISAVYRRSHTSSSAVFCRLKNWQAHWQHDTTSLARNYLAVTLLSSPVVYGVDLNESSTLALLWQIFSGTGFPNHFFCDSWVVGFWRADHEEHIIGLGSRACAVVEAVSGPLRAQGAAAHVPALRDEVDWIRQSQECSVDGGTACTWRR